MQLVLDTQHLHEVLFSEFHKERAVHAALCEGRDVLCQCERVQPASHIRYGPRAHVVRNGIVGGALVFLFGLLRQLHYSYKIVGNLEITDMNEYY